MIGIHAVNTIPDDAIEHYLTWKGVEGSHQRNAPGFVKRSLHRSVEQPNVFYYIAYWESQELMSSFGTSQLFLDAKKSAGVTPTSFPGELVFVSEVFDEVSEAPGYVADGRPMLGIHVEFVNKPGKEDALIAWKTLEGTQQRKTPGFLKRSLHRNVEQPTIFYYVSYWETQEQMETFGSSDWFKEAVASIGRQPGDYTGTLFHVTEVLNEVSERAEAIA